MEDTVASFFGPVVTLIVAVGSMIGSAYTYMASSRKKQMDALDERISGVEGDLKEHKHEGTGWRSRVSQSIAVMEQQLEHMPNKDAVHKLELKVEQINGAVGKHGEKLAGVDDKVTGIAASQQRVEDFLLRGSK